MIACLRSVRFMPADRSRSLFVELRRRHDTQARCDNKAFTVTTRAPFDRIMINKSFGTYAEAVRHWDERVRMLEDQGLVRHDQRIIGFREEG